MRSGRLAQNSHGNISSVAIKDITIYAKSGETVPHLGPLDQAMEQVRQHHGVLWIQLDQPDSAEIFEVAKALEVHELVIEDTISAHQRAKMERYGEMLYVVLHSIRLDRIEQKLHFREFHVIVGHDFVISVRRADIPDLSEVARRIERDQEEDPELVGLDSLEILHAMLDVVMDDYRPIVVWIEDQIDEVEDELFNQNLKVSRRIYDLLRDVIRFQRAADSLVEIAEDLEDGSIFDRGPADEMDIDLPGADSEELARHWRDVLDHAKAVQQKADEYRSVLDNALSVHATLVGQEQAEIAKKVSGWAAILLFPTLVAGIYGMNFDHMPELHWAFGYPFALGLMFVGALVLHQLFKRFNWL